MMLEIKLNYINIGLNWILENIIKTSNTDDINMYNLHNLNVLKPKPARIC